MRNFLLGLICILFLALFSTRAHADEWDKLEASLKSYAVRINNMQDEIREMIRKKNENPNPKEREFMLVQIKKKYKELNNLQKEMLHEKARVRFEYPEKGNMVERRYKHLKVKTLEDLENDFSLEGQMSRLKKKAEQKYNKPEPQE